MSKPSLTVSINPTYYCNFNCDFCYLTPEQLSDKNKVSLDKLNELLSVVDNKYNIQHIDLYGGELTVLPKDYQQGLLDLCRKYVNGTINLVTNLSHFNSPLIAATDVTVAVSYDQLARQYHDRVLDNMFSMGRDFSVLTLCSKKFLDEVDVDVYVDTLNMFTSLISLEIKPYSSNQANAHDVPYTRYEDFVKTIIEHPNRNFHLRNIDYMDEVIDGTHNSYSDDHIYITPQGSFAVLDFDLNGNEFFKPVKDLDEYHKWTLREKTMTNEGMCGECKYRGKCLSEHLKVVHDLENSCNGFYNLLEYWANG